MATLLLFHHVRGMTEPVLRLADSWRDAGHDVVVPDLFDGRTFDTIEEGMAYAGELGDDALEAAAGDAAAALASGFVVCGISLGVAPAMKLAVDDDGVAAVVAVGACLAQDFLDAPWPASVPLRVLASQGDAMFRDEGDLEAARELATSEVDAKVKLLPGDQHLFMEADDPESQAATDTLYESVLRLLTRIDEALPPGATAEEDAEEQVSWDLP